MRRTFAIVVAAAVLGGLAGASVGVAFGGGSSPDATTLTVASAPTPSTPVLSSSTSGGTLTSEAIYRDAAPGVVVITDTQTETVPPTFFTPSQKQEVGALGSGFVIDRRGDVLSNEHVVQGAKNIRVGFSSGATYAAKIVGSDPSSDIAVIRVQAPPSALHPLAFADSSKVEVGDPVYAIGNPFGLERTMTAGIVSATGRSIQAPNGLSIANAIQTDAAINHGNSGGPLLDRFGHVIGVNSRIQGGTVNANVGVGFAVASNTARSVALQLIATGHAEHPWLGIGFEPIDPTIARLVRGLPRQGVMVIKVVKGSPAAKAGLSAATRQVTVDGVSELVGGDTIVAVDGKPLHSPMQLSDLVAEHKPGDRLQLEVVRGGVTRTVDVTLGNAPS
ncbi:MAG TPA: trypsin-like peptidase domain-containing protein [Gaiellaceae bacterium]|nr:trypsin-like peptidase domain-containing protein [Gaiellaceae bacterium]